MADKFLEMQQQMRNNQDDLKDYLRDLDNWEDSIKKKDIELRTGSSQNKQQLPPVRNQVKEKPKRKKTSRPSPTASTQVKQDDKPTTTKPRIKAYDYRKWDQFDVDKACAEVDSGGEDTRVSSEYETDSEEERKEDTRQQKMMQANMEKEKGNEFFKKGKYEEAILCYTRGMEADSSNAILPANRAMALLKLKRFEEAENDCSLSLSLDCTYVKAVARRASARLGLAKHSEAKKDFEQVLALEPSNKLAASEIKRLDRLLKEEEDEKNLPQTNIIHAIKKPPHLRSKKPLKRINIEEIGTSPEESAEYEEPCVTMETRQSYMQKTSNEIKDTKLKESPVDVTIKESPVDVTIKESPVDVTIKESPVDVTIKESPVDVTIKESPVDVTIKESPVDVTIKESPVDVTIKEERSHKIPENVQHGTATVPLNSAPPTVPPAPQSSYHLLSDWRNLEKHPPQLVQYFKQIDPLSYPTLFKQSMESDVLSKILRLLHNHYIPLNEPMFAVVSNLTNVKRFDMNAMFMSAEEKTLVKNILEHIARNENIDAPVLKEISKKYGL